MLGVRIICVGKLKEKFFIDAFSEYSKRLAGYCKFDCTELRESRLSAAPSDKEIAAALVSEGAEILKNIGRDEYVIAMCVEGKELTSEELAERVDSLALAGRGRLCFIIGGSYGLAPEVKQRADMRLSMSKMTFPHHLARVMLAEQIYRAFKINEGSRYHK